MQRTIKYRFFSAKRFRKNDDAEDECLGDFNFINWLSKIEKRKMENIPLHDTIGRLDEMKHIESKSKNLDVWVLRFMKLRDENIPCKVKNHEAAKDLDLEDDEYLGEDQFMLYDINTGIAMIQMNRYSLGIKRLSEFIVKTGNVKNEYIAFIPIIDIDDKWRNGIFNCRRIDISFANLIRNVPQSKSALSDIMNSYRKFHGISGHIYISIGQNRKDSLDITEVNNLIEDIAECDEITSAKLAIADDDKSGVEEIDLFDNIEYVNITFNIPKRKIIGFDYAAETLSAYYSKKKAKVLRDLKKVK